MVHRAVIGLSVNEQVELEVSFCSDKPLNLKAKMLLQVADNQYNETAIQVSGEAYQEVVSLSNISRSLEEADLEEDEEGKGNQEGINVAEMEWERCLYLGSALSKASGYYMMCDDVCRHGSLFPLYILPSRKL